MRQTITSAQRDARAAELYSQGLTYQQVADAIGVKNKGDAFKIVKRAMSKVPVEAVEQLRKRQDAQITRFLQVAIGVMERSHFAHSQGRVVRACPGPGTHQGCTAKYSDDACVGIPVLDDGPKLQAITVARGLLERSAKLHGLDAPVRTAIEGDELVIRIKGVDMDAV